MTIRLLAVCGSTREHSYSGRLAIVALAAAREHEAETRLLELAWEQLKTMDCPQGQCLVGEGATEAE